MTSVTKAFVLRAVAAHGYRVTPYQWRKWQDAGLIPRAERQTFGYRHGVVGMYPIEVIDILIRLASLPKGEA